MRKPSSRLPCFMAALLNRNNLSFDPFGSHSFLYLPPNEIGSKNRFNSLPSKADFG